MEERVKKGSTFFFSVQNVFQNICNYDWQNKKISKVLENNDRKEATASGRPLLLLLQNSVSNFFFFEIKSFFLVSVLQF